MWNTYERLFSILKTNGYFYRGEALRHHLIFYYGHTAVFYINKLVVGGFLDSSKRINRYYEECFAVGVDEMSWDDLLEENYEWSGLDDQGRIEYLAGV
jgi:hypothetical protein